MARAAARVADVISDCAIDCKHIFRSIFKCDALPVFRWRSVWCRKNIQKQADK
jgi:hypothetical protein